MPAKRRKYKNRVKICLPIEDEQLKEMDKHVAKVARKKAKDGERYDRSTFIHEAIREKMEDS